MKTRRMIILLSFLAIVSVAYVFSVPAPTISELEKAAIAKKIEWSSNGNVTTGKLPIVEIPTKNPIFRIVRVFSSEISENEYHFTEYCPTIDFSIDIGEIIRNYDRAKREKAI